jgi:hypothetical protein
MRVMDRMFVIQIEIKILSFHVNGVQYGIKMLKQQIVAK